MSVTAYLLVCRSAVDGRPLAIDVFSEPSPTMCGPVRWTLAERPYAKTAGVDYESAVLRLRRAMRRDAEPWPDELLEHAQQFLDPLTADSFGPLDAAQRRPTLAECFLAESPARTDVRSRVDAWLDAHATWVEESQDRQWMRTQWQACAKMFGSTSDSALGVLLGLVRLAWGETGLTTTEWWTGWGISSGKWDCAGQRWPSEVEALVSALEYAPC